MLCSSKSLYEDEFTIVSRIEKLNVKGEAVVVEFEKER